MNIFLDDIVGSLPENGKLWEQSDYGDVTEWYVVRTVKECLDLLEAHKGEVETLSLDYNLDYGDNYDPTLGRFLTGQDVLYWLEKQVQQDPTYPMPLIEIHTGCPYKAQDMFLHAERITGG